MATFKLFAPRTQSSSNATIMNTRKNERRDPAYNCRCIGTSSPLQGRQRHFLAAAAVAASTHA